MKKLDEMGFIYRHITENPLIKGDGYCLNSVVTENYHYANNTLGEVYRGTLAHCNGMTNTHPIAISNPLAMTLSDWYEVMKSWGTDSQIAKSAALSRPRMIITTASLLRGVVIKQKPCSAKNFAEKIDYEVGFLSSYIERYETDLSGDSLEAAKLVTKLGLDCPLIGWIYYLSIFGNSAREMVDDMLPDAEKYTDFTQIERILNGY